MMEMMKKVMDDDSDKRKVQAVPAFTITSLLMLIARLRSCLAILLVLMDG